LRIKNALRCRRAFWVNTKNYFKLSFSTKKCPDPTTELQIGLALGFGLKV